VVAERCGTKHAELPLHGDEIPKRLDEALAAQDQPTMDGVNTYFVSWAARQVGLKVALSGLGGDELFAGYSTFADTPRLKRVAGLAKFLPRVLRKATTGLVRAAGGSGRSPDAARKAAAVWSEPRKLPHAYYFARTVFPPGEIEKLMEPRFRPSSVAADGYSLEPTWLGWLERGADEACRMAAAGAVSWMEMRSYMASTLLRDTDSVSMARSLEVRVPLLDTPLVEFVNTLPDQARRKDGAQKALLVEALGAMLPPEIAAQKKRTFTLPWEQWLRGPLKARAEESLAHMAPQLAPLMKPDGVRGVWHAFLAGRTSWSRPWAIFALNEWARRGGAAPTD
jgi:asparagine synthase (glutamine-hydrolysing)